MKYNGQAFEKLLKAHEERKKVLATHLEKANKQLDDLNNVKEKSLKTGDHDSFIEADIKSASIRDYIEQLRVRAEQEESAPYTWQELKQVGEDCVEQHRKLLLKAESKAKQIFEELEKVYNEYLAIYDDYKSDVSEIQGHARIIDKYEFFRSNEVSLHATFSLIQTKNEISELARIWKD
jgi:hypothetical protein